MKNLLFKKLVNLIDKLSEFVEKRRHHQLVRSLAFCGKGVRFNGKIKVSFPRNVFIENNVHIGDNCLLNGRGGITIGENTHISRNLVIFSANHNYQGECLPYDNTHTLKPVTIGRNVWIGTNVVILPGVSIGEGAIIGAGTVVNRDVPPLAIVGAPEFNILKYRDRNHYEKLDNEKKYGGVNGEPLKRSE